MAGKTKKDPAKLRSRQWFANPDNPNMTALYLERYMNWGLKREELQSGKPIIGIAQSGSDLSPCNRHHLVLAERVREGIREAGGIAFEFPVHPIQETGKRPTAALDRNLCYLGLVELLYGYFIDGVVLTTGCDKTTPAQLMAAATVDIPAIVLSGGPMLNGWFRGERTGSGTIVWKARELLAAGEINDEEFIELIASSAPSPGHCNTMGTASTMNSLAEALGMSLPGGAAIPAPHKDRAVNAYESGKRIVEMVWEDLRPSKIMTREAFENVIVVNSAIGGSTNAPIHFNAIAKHIGVKLDNNDWEKIGYDVPLLVNLQPAGEYLGEEYHRAGGVPGVVNELIKAGKIRKNALTVNGKDPVRELPSQARRRSAGDLALREADETEGGLSEPQGQSVRQRDHEDQRDLRVLPQALSVQSRRISMPGKAAPSCSTARRTTTTASTIQNSRSTTTACSSYAAPVRSAIRAVRRWSTCSRRANSSSAASPNCPASATVGSRAPLGHRRSSMRRPKLPPAADWPCSRPATGCASTSTSAPPTFSSARPRSHGGARPLKNKAVTASLPARRRGRKSSAAWWTSYPPAWS